MSAFPRLGAIAVVLRGDRVLLVQRGKAPDRGLWGFPGGHVEPGETAMQAAARELAEETGVIARPVEYLTNVDVLRHDGSGRLVAHYLLAAVLCDYRRGAPVAADDVTDAAWFDVKTVRARELPMSANVAEVMELGIARVQARRCAESQASTAADSR